MPKPGSKERVRFLWRPSVMKSYLMCSKKCVGCSWSCRHYFSHLPFPAVLQDCCKTNLYRLWTIHKVLLLLLIYIISLNIFLSCYRSVKCTLAKEKEEIPSLRSLQHRRQTVISRTEKKKSQRRKERAVLGNCHLKSMEEGRLVCRMTAVVQCLGCALSPLGQNRKVTTWRISKPCSFRHTRLRNCCTYEIAMKRASLLKLPSSHLWEAVIGGKLSTGALRTLVFPVHHPLHPAFLHLPSATLQLFSALPTVPFPHAVTLSHTVPPGHGSSMWCPHDGDWINNSSGNQSVSISIHPVFFSPILTTCLYEGMNRETITVQISLVTCGVSCRSENHQWPEGQLLLQAPVLQQSLL